MRGEREVNRRTYTDPGDVSILSEQRRTYYSPLVFGLLEVWIRKQEEYL